MCPSVRLYRFRLKFFGQGSFWWSWRPINLKLSTHVPYDMIFLFFLPQFHGPLNIENDSASGASVYLGHILVCEYFGCMGFSQLLMVELWPIIDYTCIHVIWTLVYGYLLCNHTIFPYFHINNYMCIHIYF